MRNRAGFFRKLFLPQKYGKENGLKMGQKKIWFFEFIRNWVINCDWIWSIRNFIIFAVFLHKSHTWENSGFWDMGKNALHKSDCSIFILTISLK